MGEGCGLLVNTPYDDVFRTLLNDCSSLIIPIVNEIFHESYSGDEAVEKLKGEKFDLAVLDIRVPGISGLKVLEYIRTELKSDMGVIMLTAYEDVNTQVEAFNCFADDYITKPASPIILLKRIEVLLRRINNEGDERERSLVIDDKAYKAFYEGKNLNLTVSEFLLLKALRDSPNRVFSREQLLEEVWGYEYYGDIRTVDVTVRRLREKLEDNSSHPKYIMTKRGIGYYFHDPQSK